MLYGVAILMMIYHHLFLDPVRLSVEYFSLLGGSMLGRSLEQNIAWFCKLCVAIYAFISGYGLYRSATGSRLQEPFDRIKANYRYVLNHILGLLKKYWIVFFISLPFIVALEFKGSLKEEIDYLALGLFGLSSKYNSAWWYLSQYFFMMILYPIIDFVFALGRDKKEKLVKILLIIILFFFFIGGYLSPTINQVWLFLGRFHILKRYIEVFIAGYICSRFSLFEKVNSFIAKSKMCSALLCLVVCFLCIATRMILCRGAADNRIDAIIIAPFLYSICVLMSPNTVLMNSFSYLGRYSVYMWLIHIFFIYSFGDIFVVFSRISTVMFISAVLVTLITAIFLERIEKYVWGQR